MNLTTLHTFLQSARWFSRVGTFQGSANAMAVRDLVDWEPNESDWEWLPTSHDQPDPVHGDRFKRLANQGGREEERRRVGLDAYRAALASMRRLQTSPAGLVIGPHDYFPAAKVAAAYAARGAAMECLLGGEQFWCELIPLYVEGYWPCGIDTQRRLFVY